MSLLSRIRDGYGGCDGRVDALEEHAIDRVWECSIGGYSAFWEHASIEPTEGECEA